MSRVRSTRRAVVLCALAALSAMSALSACSGSPGVADSTPTAGATVSSAPPSTTAAPCGFPSAPVSRIAQRWQAVVLAQDERAARTAAVRYRDAIGRVRTSFAITCPDLEETFNQVFVDAQFLVERTGAEDDLALADLVRNGETLVDALGLHDQVRFVPADCTAARKDDPACQPVP